MQPDSVKSRLIESLRQAQADVLKLVDERGAAEGDAAGTPERWSLKDLVAHVAAWNERVSRSLAAVKAGEPPLPDDHVDELNAETFAENRERSLEEVVDAATRIFDEFIAQIDRFSDEELIDASRYSLRDGRPLLSSIGGTGFWHVRDHLGRFYLDRGDRARATRIQEATAEAWGGLQGTPEARGSALYNLACFYATSGQPKKALTLLPKALALNPALVEWSKEDPDFESLRREPGYRALYQG